MLYFFIQDAKVAQKHEKTCNRSKLNKKDQNRSNRKHSIKAKKCNLQQKKTENVITNRQNIQIIADL
jgi:hypothetical protein